ncbi:hypothetical protein BJ742DRAFT_736084 [Cladochytrium replicatum]|nr:hypothetical protein BJ742DRAFT_736084 [Cladochytrium replicatum]
MQNEDTRTRTAAGSDSLTGPAASPFSRAHPLAQSARSFDVTTGSRTNGTIYAPGLRTAPVSSPSLPSQYTFDTVNFGGVEEEAEEECEVTAGEANASAAHLDAVETAENSNISDENESSLFSHSIAHRPSIISLLDDDDEDICEDGIVHTPTGPTTRKSSFLGPARSPLLTPIVPTSDSSLHRLNLGAFWQWVLCFCVANFDIDAGQTLEHVFPPIEFSPAERSTISFSAFPDSNSTSHAGDTIFSFRMRSELPSTDHESGSTKSFLTVTPEKDPATRTTLSTASISNGLPIETDGYTYGYVFFRQRRDAEIRRGFFQKSLVLLTPHPWHGLFMKILSILGPLYMDASVQDRKDASGPLQAGKSSSGGLSKALLEEAAFCIEAWPPVPSSASPNATYGITYLELPFMGATSTCSFGHSNRFPQLFEGPRQHTTVSTALKLEVPVTNAGTPSTPQRPLSISLAPVVPTLVSPGRFFELFSRSPELMWVCWEYMVIGEPLLVVSDTPKGCSDAIIALVELVKPPPPAAMVLGVTNPVFNSVLEHWPHVIRVSRMLRQDSSQRAQPPSLALGRQPSSSSSLPVEPPTVARTGSTNAEASTFIGRLGLYYEDKLSPSPFTSRTVSNSTSPSLSPQPNTLSRIFSGESSNPPSAGSSPSMQQRSKLNSNRSSVSEASAPSERESITSKYKPILTRDKKFVRSIVEASIRGQPTTTLNNTIRRHFTELTERFLQPLNRHFEGLIVGNPINMNLSMLRTSPEIKPFKQETFLKSIEQSVPTLPVATRRPVAELYRIFLKSPNFSSWLQARTEDVHREWRRQYLQVMCTADIPKWTEERMQVPGGEVECVDLLLRFRDELNTYQTFFIVDGDSVRYADPFYEKGDNSGSSTALDASDFPSIRVNEDSVQNSTLLSGNRGDFPFISSLGVTQSNVGGSSGNLASHPVVVMPTAEQYDGIRKQMEVLLECLPEDLRRSLIISNPESQIPNPMDPQPPHPHPKPPAADSTPPATPAAASLLWAPSGADSLSIRQTPSFPSIPPSPHTTYSTISSHISGSTVMASRSSSSFSSTSYSPPKPHLTPPSGSTTPLSHTPQKNSAPLLPLTVLPPVPENEGVEHHDPPTSSFAKFIGALVSCNKAEVKNNQGWVPKRIPKPQKKRRDSGDLSVGAVVGDGMFSPPWVIFSHDQFFSSDAFEPRLFNVWYRKNGFSLPYHTVLVIVGYFTMIRYFFSSVGMVGTTVAGAVLSSVYLIAVGYTTLVDPQDKAVKDAHQPRNAEYVKVAGVSVIDETTPATKMRPESAQVAIVSLLFLYAVLTAIAAACVWPLLAFHIKLGILSLTTMEYLDADDARKNNTYEDYPALQLRSNGLPPPSTHSPHLRVGVPNLSILLALRARWRGTDPRLEQEGEKGVIYLRENARGAGFGEEFEMGMREVERSQTKGKAGAIPEMWVSMEDVDIDGKVGEASGLGIRSRSSTTTSGGAGASVA